MIKKLICAFLGILFIVGVYNLYKPLPKNINYQSDIYQLSDSSIHFFSDATYVDDSGKRISNQEIFDEVYRMIEEAQTYVLIDLFFFSDFIGIETEAYRYLSQELTQKLIDKKKASPAIVIQIITDPINIMYGGHTSTYFDQLRSVGIPVIVTELEPLRDSNPIYSSLWRTAFQWFGNSVEEGWLPNPLDAKSPKLGMRTYFKMFNYKANHRKVVMTDYKKEDATGFSVLITSANPHDGSSAHSNIAVRVDEKMWKDVLITEQAVANLSGSQLQIPDHQSVSVAYESIDGLVSAQMLTENRIEERVLSLIDSLNNGDILDIAMFYMADRDIVQSLKKADERGVLIRILLDPNKDAFGREKNGVPNRQVAHELMSHSQGNTTIRWCNTHGEQCHSKLLLATSGDTKVLIQGSANYTKRNLGNFNLETDLVLMSTSSVKTIVEAQTFFNGQWDNEEYEFSVPYEVYEDSSLFKTINYRVKEFTGLSRW